ncbi:MAG: hypothetical protein WKF97_14385 [Chitinophagaceae bacterium]
MNWKKIGLFLLLSLAIVFPLLVYVNKFYANSLSPNLNIWYLFSQYVSGTIGPIIALLTLCVTGWIAFEFNSYQKRQTTIQLFKEFRTEELRKSRSKAWEVKANWNDNTKSTYRQGFINSMIEETESCISGTPIDKEQIQAVFDLLAFYTMLSTYKHEGKTIRHLNYFYYAWWRKFLVEVATMYDTEREKNFNEEIITHKKKGFDSKCFLQSIKYVPKLKKLDNICGLTKLDNITSTYDIYIHNS